MFTAFELKTVIKTLEDTAEMLVELDRKSESEVYITLASQLENILNKSLENPTKWVSPQDPGDEQPLPKEEYIQNVQPHSTVPSPPASVVDKMENQYPETMKLFAEINKDQYKLFAKKQADYGPGNISMNGNKALALLGLGVRMNDKTQRILNLTHNNTDPNNESLTDSFMDISIYGIIAQIVLEHKWGK